jgi:two-component system, response regulator PdtaR
MHAHNLSASTALATEICGNREPPGSSHLPARVLVVEDQVLIALSLIADLCALGCSVVGRAASGERAIEAARQTMPDIVVMDVHLAGVIDGVEAAARIQQETGTRIVFVTGHADGPDRKRMEALRPLAILGKPYDPEELARAVELTLGTAPHWQDSFAAASR